MGDAAHAIHPAIGGNFALLLAFPWTFDASNIGLI